MECQVEAKGGSMPGIPPFQKFGHIFRWMRPLSFPALCMQYKSDEEVKLKGNYIKCTYLQESLILK